MHNEYVIKELARNKLVFRTLLENSGEDLICWRPSENKWSLHEIVCHLLDEEKYDFRQRVKHILETPENVMEPIDPQGWVTNKNYGGWDYGETLSFFLKEREDSVRYLQKLQQPNWQQVHQHPKLGMISAENLLHNWLAHDYLHIRQINLYQYMFFRQQSGQNLSYAGNW